MRKPRPMTFTYLIFFMTVFSFTSTSFAASFCQSYLSENGRFQANPERLELFDEELAFSPAEYARRIAGLRQKMKEAKIGVTIISFMENLGYFTGFTTTNYDDANPSFLIVPAQGKVVAVTRMLENSNFLARSWLDTQDLRPYKDTENPYTKLASVLKSYGYDKAGKIGFDFNEGLAVSASKKENLAKVFKGKQRIDIGLKVAELRWEKSSEEITAMRQAAKYTIAGMWGAINAIKPGASLREVFVASYSQMIAAGSAPPETRPYISAGKKTLIGHATLGNLKNRTTDRDQILQEGDVVFLELTGQHYGYIAPMMRTVYVGSKPPQELLKGVELSVERLESITQETRIGTPMERLYQDFNKTDLAKIGASNWSRHGYSAGGVNFAPGWNQKHTYSIKPGEIKPLEKNSTIHVIPWLQFQKEHGFYDHMAREFKDNMNESKSFEGVVTISDTLVATKSGGVSIFEGLNPPPLDLIIKP